MTKVSKWGSGLRYLFGFNVTPRRTSGPVLAAQADAESSGPNDRDATGDGAGQPRRRAGSKKKQGVSRVIGGDQTEGGYDLEGQGVSTPDPVDGKPAVGSGENAGGWSGWVAAGFSSLAIALALPPMEWVFLAPLCLVGFSLITMCKVPLTNYRVIFWWGVIQWMLTFHFIRLPHWAGWIGWPLLAAYFALYNVAFVAAARSLIHRWRLPSVLGVPMAWCAAESLRSTLLTGFPIGLLGHTLYRFPLWIQIADIAGELTVSLFLAMVAVGLTHLGMFALSNRIAADRRSPLNDVPVSGLAGLLVVVLVIVSVYSYGISQQAKYSIEEDEAPSVIGLIQGSQDVRFGLTDQERLEEGRRSYEDHRRLTLEARRDPLVAAVVWAESMFPVLDVLPFAATDFEAAEAGRPNEQKLGWSAEQLQRARAELPWQVKETTGTGPSDYYPHRTGIQLIAGMRSLDPVNDRDFNAAVQFSPQGEVTTRYFKRHLVPFGEYLPFGDWFPAIYRLAPMSRGLSQGGGVEVFPVEGVNLVPTICYESVMGGLVRDYLLALVDDVPRQDKRDEPVVDAGDSRQSSGESDQETFVGGQADSASGNTASHESISRRSPDTLLNVSNDGWFWGSNALDLHLASNVFRAVENRITHLVVCNTGISAEISPAGRILQQATKRKAEWLRAKAPRRPASWRPLWWTLGPAPWWILSALVTLATLVRPTGFRTGDRLR